MGGCARACLHACCRAFVVRRLQSSHPGVATLSGVDVKWIECVLRFSVRNRCLNAGTNLVIVSLVNGDLDKAKEAMDCAPRGERFDTLTRVDVNGEVRAPVHVQPGGRFLVERHNRARY